MFCRFPPAPLAPDPADVLALRNMLADLGRVVEKLRTRERAAIDDVAQAAVELGIAVAERLVNGEIAADRQRLDRIVRDALERMTPARTLTVRGHADDLALLERQLTEQGELAASRSELTFRTEKACGRGQLKIEADEWFIEWDTQRSLTELRDRLLEETFANE
jgi:flagellar biosynthesis/type III secretory pathway protein FliH